jgi:hypothetical protein
MDPQHNGAGSTEGALGDAEIARQLEAAAREREDKIGELQAEIDLLRPEADRYRKAVKVLRGERLSAGGRAKDPIEVPEGEEPPTRVSRASRRAYPPSQVAPTRIAEIRAWITEYATDHDEFRQIDIRNAHGRFEDGGAFSSAVASQAFEQLRQESFNRLARSEGGSKFYRLTREALRTTT